MNDWDEWAVVKSERFVFGSREKDSQNECEHPEPVR